MNSAFVRNRKVGVTVIAACGALSLVTACSSSSNASDTTSTSAAGSTAAAGSAVSAQVTDTLKTYSAEAKIDLQPLKAKPAGGKKVVYLANSNAPTDVTNGKAFLAGSAALGWSGTTISYAGDPATLADALNQAVNDKPDAVVLSGQDPSAFANALKAAGAAGVPVFSGGVPATATGMAAGGLSGVSLGPDFLKTEGKISADWIIADSGAAADVAIFTLAVPTLESEDKGFTDELAAECPKCTAKVVNAQITDIGKALPASVVSTLQSNPKIKYLFFPYGDMSIGVASALSAANLSPKVVASTASPNTYADLKAGKTAMTLSLSTEVQGWLETDMVARYFETKAPVTNDISPMQIFDKSNSQPATIPISPADYQEQFKKLWLMAS